MPGWYRARDASALPALVALYLSGLAALPDRALIALGMALAARCSELVAFDAADFVWEEQGGPAAAGRPTGGLCG